MSCPDCAVLRQYLDGICEVVGHGPGYEGLASAIEHMPMERAALTDTGKRHE